MESRQRFLNRDGSFNVEREGLGFKPRDDTEGKLAVRIDHLHDIEPATLNDRFVSD